MMPVGPRNSLDAGRPRPIINVENMVSKDGRLVQTCPTELANSFISCFKKKINNEESSVAGRISLNKPMIEGYILKRYGLVNIPMLRLSISRSLFLNDRYFNFNYLKIDEMRINELKVWIFTAIHKFSQKHL